MDEKCDNLLDEILNEANNTFISRRVFYRRNGITSDYIDELWKLTSIVTSVKTGLVLSKPPTDIGSFPDFSDCNCES